MRCPLTPILLTVFACVQSLSLSADEPYAWPLPAWVPPPQVPADNPMSEAKVELGRHLFYDKRLSADTSMACASCHEQAKSFTDGRALSPGIDGREGVRSSMALVNVAYLPVLTWANPLMKSLESQALVPIFGSHPIELGMEGKEELLFARLRDDSHYPAMFHEAFPERQGEISLATITYAIASFERSLLSFNAPYYRYKYLGEKSAMSESAKRGEDLFFGERLECYHCHGGLSFTDNIVHSRLPFPEQGFHNTGMFNLDGNGAYPLSNMGIREVTDDPRDEGKFRTPTLLNIAVTAPYMHDGSIATLEDVILKHYAVQGLAVSEGAAPSPLRSQFIVGFEISEQDVQDILAFLHTLTDEEFLSNPRFGNPFEEATP